MSWARPSRVAISATVPRMAWSKGSRRSECTSSPVAVSQEPSEAWTLLSNGTSVTSGDGERRPAPGPRRPRSLAAALAALAGVIGGALRVTEPSMAQAVGAVVFAVIVIGGMGSLAGAFVASILIGVIQTFAVGIDASFVSAAKAIGWEITRETFGYALWKLKISQVAPILPYVLLILILIFRPKGLLGTREG